MLQKNICSSAFSTLEGLPLPHDLFLTLPACDWLSPACCKPMCARLQRCKGEKRGKKRGKTLEPFEKNHKNPCRLIANKPNYPTVAPASSSSPPLHPPPHLPLPPGGAPCKVEALAVSNLSSQRDAALQTPSSNGMKNSP